MRTAFATGLFECVCVLMHNLFEIKYVMKFEKRTGKGLMVTLNIPPLPSHKKEYYIKAFHLLQNKEG